MATTTIKNPQPQQFAKCASTMPFATKQNKHTEPQSKWDKAIADGAVTVDEFFDELDERIKKRFNA